MIAPKKASSYHHLYNTKDWFRLRYKQLVKQPLCVMCETEGRVEAAKIVDHIKPHKGDETLFYCDTNLQSLCKSCHDSRKKKFENRGYDSKIDPKTGMPVDKNHPIYRRI